MGYYSDVGIVMKNEDYKNFLEGGKNVKDFANFLKYAETNKENEEFRLIVWSYVKWYDYFPEIKYIQNFMDTHEVDFCRLGEGLDDEPKFRNDLDTCVFGVTRSMTVDW